MTRDHSIHYRIAATLAAVALSSCNLDLNKKTTFDKGLDQGQHSQKVKPQQSPDPVPSPPKPDPKQPQPSPRPSPSPPKVVVVQPSPLPSKIAPPVKIFPSPKPKPSTVFTPGPPVNATLSDVIGNYASADAMLDISTSKEFVLRSQAIVTITASPNTSNICSIERVGVVDSITTSSNAGSEIMFKVTSEKFSAFPAGQNENFCAIAGKFFSEPHPFAVPLLSAGKGFLALKLDETSTDGSATAQSPSALSGTFSDSNSVIDVTDGILKVLAGEYVGAYGGFLANLPIPRLTLSLDPNTARFNLVDNECAFSVSGPLLILGTAGSIAISSPANSVVVGVVTSAAAKTYAVYYGRASGACTARKQSFASQLSNGGIKLSAVPQSNKYTLDYSQVGGSGAKYTIRPN